MKISIFLKSLLALLIYQLGGVTWKLRQLSRYKFVIIMYHRVIPRETAREGVQAGLYVESNTFERQLLWLKRFFSIVATSEIPFFLKRKSDAPNSKPVCILTFDDGWCDFHSNVFPILKANNVPATIFLTTDFIGTKNWFWTDRLAFLLHQRCTSKQSKELNNTVNDTLVYILQNLEGSDESRLEKAIELLKGYPERDIERVIEELSSMWGLLSTPPGRAFLSWDEIRTMAQSDLITFGSHTASHRILTNLELAEVAYELVSSKEKLIAEKVVDPEFIPFCYPNGNFNDRIVKIAEKVGYNLAVTTNNGWNQGGSNPFTLRRVPIHQDMTYTEAMLGCRIVGLI